MPPAVAAKIAGPQSPEFKAQVLYPGRKITVDQYHKLLEMGYLEEGDPVELLEGYMVHKMPRGVPHDEAIEALCEFLRPLLPRPWYDRVQCALTIPTDGEPEPDFNVVRGPRGRMKGRHPHPADVGLLVEVSDSSLPIDRGDKARLYAGAGVPVYWVVNIPDRQVEVFTRPSGAGDNAAYAQHDIYPVGASVPVVLDGTPVGTVAVADIIS